MTAKRTQSRLITRDVGPNQFHSDSPGPLGRHDAADPNVTAPPTDSPRVIGTHGDRAAEAAGPATHIVARGTIRVYYWQLVPIVDYLGHSSMMISTAHSSEYVSWWPSGEEKTYEEDHDYYGAPARFWSYAWMDAGAAMHWVRAQGRVYDMFSKNCATVIAGAMRAAQAPEYFTRDLYVWAPPDIARWCAYLDATYPNGPP